MKEWFQRLIDLSTIARTDASLKQALPELAQGLGFDCYAYLNVQPVRRFAVSNYPEEWQARYLGSDYTSIDPVVSMARETMTAFSWAAGHPSQSFSKRVRTFYAESGDFGIRSGLSIPVRTAVGHMSMLTLASDRPSLSLEKRYRSDRGGDSSRIAACHN